MRPPAALALVRVRRAGCPARESVAAIKAHERSESLDSFYRIKLHVTRNRSYLWRLMKPSYLCA
jgi:hypothetical protein